MKNIFTRETRIHYKSTPIKLLLELFLVRICGTYSSSFRWKYFYFGFILISVKDVNALVESIEVKMLCRYSASVASKNSLYSPIMMAACKSMLKEDELILMIASLGDTTNTASNCSLFLSTLQGHMECKSS